MLPSSKNTRTVATKRRPPSLRMRWPRASLFHQFKSPTFDHRSRLLTMLPPRCHSKHENPSSVWSKSRARLVSILHTQLHPNFNYLYIIGPDMSIMVSPRLDMVLPIDHIWIIITLRQKSLDRSAFHHRRRCIWSCFDFRRCILFSPTRSPSLDTFKSRPDRPHLLF
jgi:hypothetical protein